VTSGATVVTARAATAEAASTQARARGRPARRGAGGGNRSVLRRMAPPLPSGTTAGSAPAADRSRRAAAAARLRLAQRPPRCSPPPPSPRRAADALPATGVGRGIRDRGRHERARACVWEMILGGEAEGRGRPSPGQKPLPMSCGPTQGKDKRTGCELLPARRPSMPNRMSCAECGRGREPASCAVHRKHQTEPVPMTMPRTRAAAGRERDSPPRSSRSPAPATKLFGTCATKQHASLRCHLKHARGIETVLEDIPVKHQGTGGRCSTCRLGSC